MLGWRAGGGGPMAMCACWAGEGGEGGPMAMRGRWADERREEAPWQCVGVGLAREKGVCCCNLWALGSQCGVYQAQVWVPGW
eukprot:350556-Chlamydomonas_euryale.AAC.1